MKGKWANTAEDWAFIGHNGFALSFQLVDFPAFSERVPQFETRWAIALALVDLLRNPVAWGFVILVLQYIRFGHRHGQICRPYITPPAKACNFI